MMATSSYVPLFELASGGMGVVTLEVRQLQGFERLYAIKRLRGQAAEDPDIQRMFLEEARLAGLLRHPNVVSVLDVGEDEQGALLVMEWIDGVPLQRFVRGVAREGPLPIGLCCQICAQVARGLHAAHELQTHAGEPLPLVHRDVSPSNILVGFDGLVRVTDFGIAKALGGESTTGQGILKGKFGYMSPEQLRFDEIDRRSDLFSLGVVLFEMLCAKRLYGGSASVEETARRILREEPPTLGDRRRDAPPDLEELLLEMLAKDPRMRPEDAREVSDRLEAIAREFDEGIQLDDFLAERFGDARGAFQTRIADALAEVASQVQRASPRVVQPTQRKWGGLAVVVAAAGVLGGVWWVSQTPEPAAGATLAEGEVGEPLASPDDPTEQSADSSLADLSPAETGRGQSAMADPIEGTETSPEMPEDEVAAPDHERPTMRRTRPTMRRSAIPRPGEGGFHAPE